MEYHTEKIPWYRISKSRQSLPYRLVIFLHIHRIWLSLLPNRLFAPSSSAVSRCTSCHIAEMPLQITYSPKFYFISQTLRWQYIDRKNIKNLKEKKKNNNKKTLYNLCFSYYNNEDLFHNNKALMRPVRCRLYQREVPRAESTFAENIRRPALSGPNPAR